MGGGNFISIIPENLVRIDPMSVFNQVFRKERGKKGGGEQEEEKCSVWDKEIWEERKGEKRNKKPSCGLNHRPCV